VREQEVQVRRLERGEGAVYGDGVAADVDGREQPGVDLPVALAAQQVDGAQHLVVAAAPVGVPAVQVVGRPVAVERDPDLDPLGAEQLAQLGVEPYAVRVDAQVKTADGFDRAAQPLGDRGEGGGAGQQRLPAVQDDAYFREPVVPRVLGNALPRLGDRLR
jgi:hypothetical protein